MQQEKNKKKTLFYLSVSIDVMQTAQQLHDTQNRTDITMTRIDYLFILCFFVFFIISYLFFVSVHCIVYTAYGYVCVYWILLLFEANKRFDFADKCICVYYDITLALRMRIKKEKKNNKHYMCCGFYIKLKSMRKRHKRPQV